MTLLAAHLVGDFILQSNDTAKRKLDEPRVRAMHVTRYCLPFLVAGILGRERASRLLTFLILLWISHFIIDSKRWIPNEEWTAGTYINDQALHAVQLALLRRIV
jgi:hypothetical protein